MLGCLRILRAGILERTGINNEVLINNAEDAARSGKPSTGMVKDGFRKHCYSGKHLQPCFRNYPSLRVDVVAAFIMAHQQICEAGLFIS